MNPVVLVGVGGILGAVARFTVSERIETASVDTLAVNVLGSFVLGALTVAPVADTTGFLVGVGFCGAFTTFSTFAVETVDLIDAGQRDRALANAGVNLVGALLAVAAGAFILAAFV